MFTVFEFNLLEGVRQMQVTIRYTASSIPVACDAKMNPVMPWLHSRGLIWLIQWKDGIRCFEAATAYSKAFCSVTCRSPS